MSSSQIDEMARDEVIESPAYKSATRTKKNEMLRRAIDRVRNAKGPAHPSLSAALITAQGFVKGYPFETGDKGLLFVGSYGVGKTHLAVGILEALIRERGVQGLFCVYDDLLKQVKNSYNSQVSATEMDILRPVFDAEVLVLDELGASKPTDWVWDTVAHLLNTRYNNGRTTIITTNYRNAPSAAAMEVPEDSAGNLRHSIRQETLGDRIGDRMRSRLMEMCVVLEMHGEDWRQTKKRARFGKNETNISNESNPPDDVNEHLPSEGFIGLDRPFTNEKQ